MQEVYSPGLKLSASVGFTAAAAGSSLVGTRVGVGSFAVTLPTTFSGNWANITSSGVVVGGVISPKVEWGSLFLDFLVVGGAGSQSLVVEVGQILGAGILARPLSLLTLTSSALTFVNVNPFTGAVAAVTYRTLDVGSQTDYGQLGQVLKNMQISGGAVQYRLATADAPYYYGMVTSLGAGPFTSALVHSTPGA